MDGWTALRQSRLFRRLTADGGGFCRQAEVTWSRRHRHADRLAQMRDLDLADPAVMAGAWR